MEPSPNPGNSRIPFWLRALVILLVLAGAALTAFFGVRVLRGVQMLHRARQNPVVTDVTLIKSWMSLPYLARAYHVPEAVLWQGVGIPENGNRHKSLRVLAREYAEPTLIDKVKAIIREYQAQHPPTPTGPPRSGPAQWPLGGDTAI